MLRNQPEIYGKQNHKKVLVSQETETRVSSIKYWLPGNVMVTGLLELLNRAKSS